MKHRPAFLLVGMLAPLLILLAVATVAIRQRADVAAPSAATEAIARRAITPTFGIHDVLTLSDGNVLVSGHARCDEGGSSFRVQVRVAQPGISAPAQGSTNGSCQDDVWTALAVTPGPFLLEPGTAEVCAHAVIQAPGEGAVVQDWCKQVTLE